MRSTPGSFGARPTPSSNDNVARASFSAGLDGSIDAKTDVRGNANLRMSGTTTNQAGQTNSVTISQNAAQQQIEQIASQPGNSTLKLTLAQQGISLTDHSDVGPGRRFATFSEKLSYIMRLKVAVLVEVMMSMASSSGWGPSETEGVSEARETLRTGIATSGREASERGRADEQSPDRDASHGEDSRDRASDRRGPQRDASDRRSNDLQSQQRNESRGRSPDRGAVAERSSDNGHSARAASARSRSDV